MTNLETALSRLQSITVGRYIPTAGMRVAFHFPDSGPAIELETAFQHNYIVVDSKQEHGIRDSTIKVGDIEVLISSPVLHTPPILNDWQPIETAPRDGTWFAAKDGQRRHRTQWGKTSHVPLYGWCYVSDQNDGDPQYDLWEPTHWNPVQRAPII